MDLMAALREIGLPAAVVSRDGRITWQNELGMALFGDQRGSAWSVTVVQEDGARAREQFEQKLNGDQVATNYEVDLVMVDGRRVRAEISSVVLPGDDPDRAVLAVARLDPEARPPAETALSPRLTQVLHLLGEGASTAQIAEQLRLSTETVRNYVRLILRALDAHSRLEAVAIARRRGLL